MERVNTSKRLAQLRDLMERHEFDIYGIMATRCNDGDSLP